MSATARRRDVVDVIAELTARVRRLELGARRRALPGFIAASLGGGWTNFGAGLADAAYYRDDTGVVHLRGTVNVGALNSVGFTLPAGYRPSAELRFGTTGEQIGVDAGGQVINRAGTSPGVRLLDGISFPAEQ